MTTQKQQVTYDEYLDKMAEFKAREQAIKNAPARERQARLSEYLAIPQERQTYADSVEIVEEA